MKFLIVRFSSIGDIVLTSPVIRCLKQQVPGVEIHFLVKEAFREVVEYNPYIDKLHVLAHSWELMIEELKLENYDYIIDLHNNVKTLRLKNELKVKSFWDIIFLRLIDCRWMPVNVPGSFHESFPFQTKLLPDTLKSLAPKATAGVIEIPISLL